MPDEKKPSIDDLIADLGETKKEVNLTKLEAQKTYKIIGDIYYENERLEQALEGAIQNLDPLSGHTQPLGEIEYSLLDGSKRLRDFVMERRYQLGDIATRFTDISTTVASGLVILASSTNIYSENIERFHLSPTPPSIQMQIDPYGFDQKGVEEELIAMLREIDEKLYSLYSDIKDVFKAPHRNRLDFAATEMRKLIWEILRKLAPHDKVSSANGFIQDPQKDPGVPTYRQQLAYIITGDATLKGPREKLINSVFEAIDQALSAFSGRIKAFESISDAQIRINMAACERAILTLLKNRKV